MKTIYLLVGIAFLAIGAVKNVDCQSNAAAANVAAQAANSNNKPGKPVFDVSGAGGGNNRKNWNAAGSFGVGTKVWESQNGRHAIGVGANAAQSGGRFQGQSYQSKPDFGAGAAYRYRFGK